MDFHVQKPKKDHMFRAHQKLQIRRRLNPK